MFIHPFETSSGGIFADEMKIHGRFRFGVFNNGNFLFIESDGENVTVENSVSGSALSAAVIVADDDLGIEIDTTNGNYKIINNNAEIETGTIELSGSCFFYCSCCDQENQTFENNYTAGAKKFNGATI